MSLWDIIKTATRELWHKLRLGGWQLILAAALPSACLVGSWFWLAEFYAAAIGLRVVQFSALVFVCVLSLVFFSLILSRTLLRLIDPPRRPAPVVLGFRFSAADIRVMGGVATYTVLAVCLWGAFQFAEFLATKAFFVAGSEGIAALVVGALRAMIALCGLYLCARFSLILTAAVVGGPGLTPAWEATDEDAALLLCLIWFVPVLIFMVTGGLVLFWLGAIPLAAGLQSGSIIATVENLRAYWWFAIPALWGACVASFCVMAANLAIAHERLISGNNRTVDPFTEATFSVALSE